MPVYMEIEGIKGTVKASSHAGGANFAPGDGSVKNTGRAGGHKFTLERHYDSSGLMPGAIEVSRIEVANTSFGAIDALAPNAVVKARALFEAQRSMVTSLGVIFSISESGANKLRHANNLRQISLAAHGQISTLKLFISDASDPSGVFITLENVRLSESLFNSALMGEGKKVRIDFCK